MGVFGRAIIREIGRNVGKGISNDLFGDWHATPVRGSISSSNKMGYDLNLVDTTEYDVSNQPFLETPSVLKSIFLFGFLPSLTGVGITFSWVMIIVYLLKSKTNLYAKVPARTKDGRTKTGYRESGTYFIKLKSKRQLTQEEKAAARMTALWIAVGHFLLIGVALWASQLEPNA